MYLPVVKSEEDNQAACTVEGHLKGEEVRQKGKTDYEQVRAIVLKITNKDLWMAVQKQIMAVSRKLCIEVEQYEVYTCIYNCLFSGHWLRGVPV